MLSMVIDKNSLVQIDCPSCKKGVRIVDALHILCPSCFEPVPDAEAIIDSVDERLMYHTDGDVFL